MIVKEKTAGPLYKGLKSYLQFVFNNLYYRRFHCIGRENVPSDGASFLIVSNHQNCLNDAFGILFAFPHRRIRFIARADVFGIHPLVNRFLQWAGVMPAYRMQYQGEEALPNNLQTFQDTEEHLLNGHPVLLFPEAGHQSRRWLGSFAFGYTRMAFEAAEQSGFQKEIFILPTCNHYSNYFAFRSDMLVRIGTPVSIQPFYELYRTKPRTAQREVNKLVREQIQGMMLDIRDLDHYAEIDFLRESSFGSNFARQHKLDPHKLPEKLEADRMLVSLLEEKGISCGEITPLREALENLGLKESQLENPPSPLRTAGEALLLLLTLPLGIIGLWPAAFTWLIPRYFTRKLQDPMLLGSFALVVLVLSLPIGFVLTLAAEWPFLGAWALLHGCLLPLLFVFEVYWVRLWMRTLQDFRFLKAGSRMARDLRELRRKAFERIKNELEI